MDRDTQEQVVSDLMGSPHQITEAELRGFCKTYVDIYTCAANHTVHCMPAPLQSLVQGLFNRTLALTGVCERPDFFTKAQILLGCVQSTVRVYRKFTQEERRAVERQNAKCDVAVVGVPYLLASYLEPVTLEPLVFYNESALLLGACCRLKEIVTCLPRVPLIRQQCTFEAVDLGRTILKGLFDYYDCPNILQLAANACPKVEETIYRRFRY